MSRTVLFQVFWFTWCYEGLRKISLISLPTRFLDESWNASYMILVSSQRHAADGTEPVTYLMGDEIETSPSCSLQKRHGSSYG